VAYYVLLMVDLYLCRGLPTLYDHELMRQAEAVIVFGSRSVEEGAQMSAMCTAICGKSHMYFPLCPLM
jgi:hypothetical protein